MKHNLHFIWLTALLLLVGQSGWAYDAEIDGIYYYLDSNWEAIATVTSGESYSGSITIPSTVTYKGTLYNVTSIGSHAFSDCIGLTNITIPSSVTSIDNGAFYGCSGLTDINIPNSVTRIGEHAFSGCI